MVPPTAKIQPPWWIRLLIYWCLPWLAYVAWTWQSAESWFDAVALAASIFLICEIYVFGYQIELHEDFFIYRDRGIPWNRKKRVNRVEIESFVFQKAQVRSGSPWQYVELKLTPSAGSRLEINLAAFRAADISIFLEWLSAE